MWLSLNDVLGLPVPWWLGNLKARHSLSILGRPNFLGARWGSGCAPYANQLMTCCAEIVTAIIVSIAPPVDVGTVENGFLSPERRSIHEQRTRPRGST